MGRMERIAVLGQFRQKQKVCQTHLMEENWVLVAFVCHPAMTGSIKYKMAVQASQGKKQDTISKIATVKRAGDVTQQVASMNT
jgi:hypothetical protein